MNKIPLNLVGVSGKPRVGGGVIFDGSSLVVSDIDLHALSIGVRNLLSQVDGLSQQSAVYQNQVSKFSALADAVEIQLPQVLSAYNLLKTTVDSPTGLTGRMADLEVRVARLEEGVTDSNIRLGSIERDLNRVLTGNLYRAGTGIKITPILSGPAKGSFELSSVVPLSDLLASPNGTILIEQEVSPDGHTNRYTIDVDPTELLNANFIKGAKMIDVRPNESGKGVVVQPNAGLLAGDEFIEVTQEETGQFKINWIGSGGQGEKGERGYSAYEIAVSSGFVGTQEQWLASLKATAGSAGKSAYELAVASGFQGTQAQWLASLVGAAGKSAYELAVANGFVGTQAQWLASLKPADGKSAYQLAVANGFNDTEAAWLASLKGTPGVNGVNGKDFTASADRGRLPFAKPGSDTQGVVWDAILTNAFVVEDQADFDRYSTVPVQTAEIFGQWKRFSHASSLGYPASSSETNAWVYDAASKSVRCTSNTSTYVGFVSSEEYSDYFLSAKIGSGDGDDDAVCVVLAYKDDGTTQHTLSLMRAQGGVVGGSTYCLLYNFNQAGEKILVNLTSAVTDAAGWSGTFSRIVIRRTGNKFQMLCSQNGQDVIDSRTLIELDLDSDAVLAVFKDKAGYGYGALSQNDAYFADIKFVPHKGEIYRADTGDLLRLDATGAYKAVAGRSVLTDFEPNRMVWSQYSNKLFYIGLDYQMRSVNGEQMKPVALTFNSKNKVVVPQNMLIYRLAYNGSAGSYGLSDTKSGSVLSFTSTTETLLLDFYYKAAAGSVLQLTGNPTIEAALLYGVLV